MYEKYNAYVVGEGGGGGEYKPQVGFGWTNGVALVLLNATRNFSEISVEKSGNTKKSLLCVWIALPVLGVCLAVLAWWGWGRGRQSNVCQNVWGRLSETEDVKVTTTLSLARSPNDLMKQSLVEKDDDNNVKQAGSVVVHQRMFMAEQ
jgi:hypothetical protein